MSYTVLARRYRSGRFADVIGQQAVAQTLRNAIEQDRVAHAYLFCGTRGVGKTSMARLFARALNAPDSIEDAPRTPGAEYPPPDVQDRMAAAITTGEDLNVIEIDGASNNSVEQARQLISGAGLSPTAHARFKVYIIDEVHMLSTAAFNALLKTMEEPPAHVKFILCTTEPHKVPPTIQSRCQRFDFRNIPAAAIAEHLTNVLSHENIDAEPSAVFQVARLANGSMRDGLSLLDRLIATGQSPLTTATIEQMFGLPNAERVMALIDAFAAGDVKAALEQTHGLLDSGIGQDQLLETLIEQLRQLMLISACGIDSPLVELPDDARRDAAERAAKFDAPALTYMIALCESVQRQSGFSVNPRALLDAAVVRLALAENMADITALLRASGSVPAGASQGELKKKVAAESAAPAPGVVASATHAPAAPSVPDPHGLTPASVLAALRQRTGSRVDCNWLRYMELTELDESSVTLTATPGHAQLLVAARTERMTNLIVSELQAILGRRVRLQLRAPHTSIDDASPAQAAAPARGRGVDRNDLDLPLVREMLKAFPDATAIESRGEE